MNNKESKKQNKLLLIVKWIVKKIFCFLRSFFSWSWSWFLSRGAKTQFAILMILVLLSGSLIGYGIGRYHGHQYVKKVEQKYEAKYKKDTTELKGKIQGLEEDVKLKNPKERPWNLVLVNDTHPMKEGYVPKLAKAEGKHKVDERIVDSLKKMLKDARKAGVNPMICSSYRDVDYQKRLYNAYMGNAVKSGLSYWEALEKTMGSTAYPGRSEHNLGLAVDIVSSSYTTLDKKQEETPEAKWLAENCHKYGFILRYPSGKTEITGIIYEPWHYRYVGVEDATKIMKSGVTLEEYLGED